MVSDVAFEVDQDKLETPPDVIDEGEAEKEEITGTDGDGTDPPSQIASPAGVNG